MPVASANAVALVPLALKQVIASAMASSFARIPFTMAEAMRPAPINAILVMGLNGVDGMFGDGNGAAAGTILEDQISTQ